MSIIREYEKYKDNTPAIGNIMIWSLDGHLKGYNERRVLNNSPLWTNITSSSYAKYTSHLWLVILFNMP